MTSTDIDELQLPEKVAAFLLCFKGYRGRDESRDSFHFDPGLAAKRRDPAWIDAYSVSVGEKVHIIGEASNGYIILCMTARGKIIGGYDDQIMLFGETVGEALANLYSNKNCLPTIKFKDTND